MTTASPGACPPTASNGGLAALEKLFAAQLAAQAANTSAQFAALTARFDGQITAQEKMANLALSAANAAVAKAEAAAEKRFENVNEFRGTLADQQKTLLPRTEFDTVIAAMRETLNVVAARVTVIEGDARQILGKGQGYGALAGWIVAGVVFTGALLALITRLGAMGK